MSINELTEMNTARNLFELKTKLLINGLRVPEGFEKGRKSGAGPAGGAYLQLGQDTVVNTPTWTKFAQNSQLSLRKSRADTWIVVDGEAEFTVKPLLRPKFYDRFTRDGVLMSKVALRHGLDCIASTVVQTCVYWRSGEQCRFCGIELSLKDNNTVARKTPKQLIEVVDEALAEGVCKHVTLTTGTPTADDKGIKLYVGLVEALKAIHPSLPIQVQFEPPKVMLTMDELQRAGVDSVGIHLESFDKDVLRKMCPGKSRTPIEEYIEAWRYAVELFGEGQVSTYLIAGLGESDESIVPASRMLANLGVVPYLVPVRPMAGTPIENSRPPSYDRLINLYRDVADVLNESGLDPSDSKAGCPRCGACSALDLAVRETR